MSEEMNSNLRDFENQLASMLPAAHTIDRDHLLFEAGQQQGLRRARRQKWPWQGATAVLTGICAGLLLTNLASHQQTPTHPAPAPIQMAQQSMPHDTTPGTRLLPLALFNDELWTTAPTQLLAEPPAQSYLQQQHKLFSGETVPSLTNPTESDGYAARLPALRRAEGLDALPQWQLQAALFGGTRL